jgi:AcrR family transcriptional regulator
MNTSLHDAQPAPGLRERKKAKTRAAIQRHALRLFREQGYEATTVNQIAEAAEISPSTFFRYFPTKEDVVLYDAIDPVAFAAFEAQPPELSTIEALRRSIHEVISAMPADEIEEQRQRGMLIFSVPELRLRMLSDMLNAGQQFAALVARRVGRRADDVAVRTFVGALFGAIIGALLPYAQDPNADFLTLMDASLAYLEDGMPL